MKRPRGRGYAEAPRHFGVSFATLRVCLLQQRLISRTGSEAVGETSPSRLAVVQVWPWCASCHGAGRAAA